MSRNFDLLHLAREDNDSYQRLPSHQMTLWSRDTLHPAHLVAAENQAGESDLLTVVRVFRRRWRTAAWFAGIIMTVTVLVTLLMTPLYAPDVRIEIGPPGSEAFSINHDDLAHAQSPEIFG